MNNYSRLFPTFSITFVLIFALCVYFNWALFTYFPAAHQLKWFVPDEAKAPATYPMFWYGWLATTTIATVLITGTSAIVVGRGRSVAPTVVWTGAIVAMIIIVYALAHWFTMS
jgi:hypothetical protein